MASVTEMAVFAQGSGSVSHYGVSAFTPSNNDSRASTVLAGRWVDPALGFAVSINIILVLHRLLSNSVNRA